MVYAVEYKAPHKLTLPHLRIGLRLMDIRHDVIHRLTGPAAADEEALFQYHTDKLVALPSRRLSSYRCVTVSWKLWPPHTCKLVNQSVARSRSLRAYNGRTDDHPIPVGRIP